MIKNSFFTLEMNSETLVTNSILSGYFNLYNQFTRCSSSERHDDYLLNLSKKILKVSGNLDRMTRFIVVISYVFIPISNLGSLVIFTVLPSALIPCIYSWWLWKVEQNDDQSSNEQFK
jgi:hypothetical protein